MWETEYEAVVLLSTCWRVMFGGRMPSKSCFGFFGIVLF
jgi:hypothetical protein